MNFSFVFFVVVASLFLSHAGCSSSTDRIEIVSTDSTDEQVQHLNFDHREGLTRRFDSTSASNNDEFFFGRVEVALEPVSLPQRPSLIPIKSEILIASLAIFINFLPTLLWCFGNPGYSRYLNYMIRAILKYPRQKFSFLNEEFDAILLKKYLPNISARFERRLFGNQDNLLKLLVVNHVMFAAKYYLMEAVYFYCPYIPFSVGQVGPIHFVLVSLYFLLQFVMLIQTEYLSRTQMQALDPFELIV